MDCPIKHGGSFQTYVKVYQRVYVAQILIYFFVGLQSYSIPFFVDRMDRNPTSNPVTLGIPKVHAREPSGGMSLARTRRDHGEGPDHVGCQRRLPWDPQS